jgi:hypothetical protein
MPIQKIAATIIAETIKVNKEIYEYTTYKKRIYMMIRG